MNVILSVTIPSNSSVKDFQSPPCITHHHML